MRHSSEQRGMRADLKDRRQKIAFGDFQTPEQLAVRVCRFLADRGIAPKTIIEPTCGVGNFVFAAADTFPNAESISGFEINRSYLARSKATAASRNDHVRFRFQTANFYTTDWQTVLKESPDPVLIIGNPPWVTNSVQGVLEADNLPTKSNLHRQRGIDAITGKANFDVSEWMLLKLFGLLEGRRAVLAMLCKTAIARRVLSTAWQRKQRLQNAEIHRIDALKNFHAAVDSCLLFVEFGPRKRAESAKVFSNEEAFRKKARGQQLGWRDGRLIADLKRYERTRTLQVENRTSQQKATQVNDKWRSGIKHDCAAVLELEWREGTLWNKLGELVEVESTSLYPLLKSGDLNPIGKASSRWLLLPQRRIGEDTRRLSLTAPKTWDYLRRHADRFDCRRSSIYRDQPPFAIFGIGEYSFAEWKVAVSGLAKTPHFTVVGSRDGRPCVLDDASYFLPCASQQDATDKAGWLNSSTARDFFMGLVFWDAKRPITAEILNLLDLQRLGSDAHLA